MRRHRPAARTPVMIEHDGHRFRDLDHDGVVAPYEDWRLDPGARADDLLARMTLDEKIGELLHGTLPAAGGPLAVIGVGDGYDLDAVRALVHHDHVGSFITRLSLPPAALAAQNNAVQEIAAATRLGIPVMISTDPRNHFSSITGASVDTAGNSRWPGPLGFGAIGDPDVVRAFADVVRREYRAVGITMALSPQADLATEPRWPRADGTFGSDPAAVRALVGAYVEGIQGADGALAADGVAAVVKHWVGYGAAPDGFDGHNTYGRYSPFPGERFADHVMAFLDAFGANVAGVMPTYTILQDVVIDGMPVEPVGGGFSEVLVQRFLRGTHGYTGLVVSDWAIFRDLNESGRTGVPPQQAADIAMPWGVEHLSRAERFALALRAGVDQFGGEQDPVPLRQAVADGLVDEARLDVSVRRVLITKFRLGLFEQPFVDVDAATAIVADPANHAAALDAQHRSITVLEGELPALTPDDRVYLHGIEPVVGLTLADDLDDATVAIVRLTTPFQTLHPEFFFGRRQHEGDLDFTDGDEQLAVLQTIAAKVPTIVVVNLDRPAILTNIVPLARVLVAEYGASDTAVVDVLRGRANPVGRLPFELPRDMDSVREHPCDRPGGLRDPLYPLGYGR